MLDTKDTASGLSLVSRRGHPDLAEPDQWIFWKNRRRDGHRQTAAQRQEEEERDEREGWRQDSWQG